MGAHLYKSQCNQILTSSLRDLTNRSAEVDSVRRNGGEADDCTIGN